VRIHTKFNLPDKIKRLKLNAEVVIADTCEDFKDHPSALKILLLTPKGLVQAGRCRADFYARDMEDVYLWLRLLSSYRP